MYLMLKKHHVAPRVGAWIEILIGGLIGMVIVVAPRVGAWIEIYIAFKINGTLSSPLV